MLQEEINSSHGSDEEAPDLEAPEVKPEAHSATRAAQVEGSLLHRTSFIHLNNNVLLISILPIDQMSSMSFLLSCFRPNSFC